MTWSDTIRWGRFIEARRKKATTEACQRDIHSDQINSPLLFLNILGRPAIMLCTVCGRTFEEILDAEVARAEESAPAKSKATAAVA